MKIGIVAPQLQKNHITYYDAIITLFLEKHYLVSIFADPWLVKELSLTYPNIEYVTKKEKESFFLFFRRIRKMVKEFDLIIIEQSYGITLSYIFGLSRIKVKKLYTVHNVNSWLAPTFSLKFRGFFTNLSHKYIIDNADGVIVVSANLKKFITSLNLIEGKPTFYLPFSLPKTNWEAPIEIEYDRETISLVVPGTINPLRRDYITLLNAFEKVIKQEIRNIQLVLLGKPNHEIEETNLVIQKIKEINIIQEKSIIYWNEFIPHTEFKNYLSNADFFILNLNIFYPYSENYEIYGITKETGISTLMCEYRKPCIIIGDYILPAELKQHVISGSTENDVKNIFIQISEKKIIPTKYTQYYDSSLKKIDLKIQIEFNQLLDFISLNSKN